MATTRYPSLPVLRHRKKPRGYGRVENDGIDENEDETTPRAPITTKV